jgi:hypothetical protein
MTTIWRIGCALQIHRGSDMLEFQMLFVLAESDHGSLRIR